MPESIIVLTQRYLQLKSIIGDEYAKERPVPILGRGRKRRDARKDAAERLGAGVSYATFEKVAWLLEVSGNTKRPLGMQAAWDALAAIRQGGTVDWPYKTAVSVALIEELDHLSKNSDPEVRSIAEREYLRVRRFQKDWRTDKLEFEVRQAVQRVQTFRNILHYDYREDEVTHYFLFQSHIADVNPKPLVVRWSTICTTVRQGITLLRHGHKVGRKVRSRMSAVAGFTISLRRM
ncbi:MAG: hypothetical protein LBG99_02285 [Propionibacteriaceae bacterium]|jgi:hypothetical protein|nr:hypothetical protein [Propionibacteriaceae bacterium]